MLLAVAGDLAQGRRDGALRRLDALGGHDRRFESGVETAKAEIAARHEPAEGLRMLEEALVNEDRSLAAITRSVIGTLREAARPAVAESAKRTN